MGDEGRGEAAGTADPRIGKLLTDKYRVVRPLASGGMGRVYLARHQTLNQYVAVKILPAGGSDEQVKRFRREAHAAAKLQSPHVVRVFDFGELPDGAFFLAMELLRGRDLSSVIRAEAPVEPHRAILILDQVAAALEEAHGVGIVHRDLKPENVFLVDDQTYGEFVKILDFGVSKVQMAGDGEPVTLAGKVLGTPGFMAPEQAAADDPEAVGPSADAYALGCLATELLTGKPAFAPRPPAKMLLAVVHEPPRLPSELGLDRPGLDELMARVLSKVPADRPGPQELVTLLAGVLGVDVDDGARSQQRLRVPSVIRSSPPPGIDAWPGSDVPSGRPPLSGGEDADHWPVSLPPPAPRHGLRISTPGLVGAGLLLLAIGVLVGLLF